MFKKILFIPAVLISLSLASCLGDGESDPTYTTAGYYTITGSLTSGYTLYCDFGGKIIPSTTDVVALAGKDGFGDHHRAFLYCTYKDSELSQDQTVITGGTITQLGYLPEKDILSAEAAAEQNVNVADSTFEVTSFSNAWAYRGYLTTLVSGYYSYTEKANIIPTLSAVIDPQSIAENTVAIDLIYNRHTSQDAYKRGPIDVVSSFTLPAVEPQIPGSDSVNVTIRCKGASARKIRVGRRDFHFQ